MIADPEIVVDIGNTRMKWGWLDRHGTMQVSRLAPDDPPAWLAELTRLSVGGAIRWAIASVHPLRLDRFVRWCEDRGDVVRVMRSRHDLPLEVTIREPDRVGLDRLLGAVAANSRRQPGRPAITIDIGTAVTCNSLDEHGRFVGGAILPGARLMASALHQFTAKLPLVNTEDMIPSTPGQATDEAIRLGIHAAILGAIRSYCERFGSDRTDYFLTGGGAPLVVQSLALPQLQHVPTLNLEGLRIAAHSQR